MDRIQILEENVRGSFKACKRDIQALEINILDLNVALKKITENQIKIIEELNKLKVAKKTVKKRKKKSSLKKLVDNQEKMMKELKKVPKKRTSKKKVSKRKSKR